MTSNLMDDIERQQSTSSMLRQALKMSFAKQQLFIQGGEKLNWAKILQAPGSWRFEVDGSMLSYSAPISACSSFWIQSAALQTNYL